jgi:hypothetical protein
MPLIPEAPHSVAMLCRPQRGEMMQKHVRAPAPYAFEMDELITARAKFLREARALPTGPERNIKREIARGFRRLIQKDLRAQRDSRH